MIAQTYCGKHYNFPTHPGEFPDTCGELGIPCPSCLREHIARLEARVGELESLLITQDKDALVWQTRVRELEAKAAAQAGGVVVPELTGTPILQEEFADNGEHSHWNLFDSGTGELLWTEAPEEEWHKHHRRPLCALPASRVLGEGQEAISTAELSVYRGWEEEARSIGADEVRWDELVALRTLDALRAAKGGAT